MNNAKTDTQATAKDLKPGMEIEVTRFCVYANDSYLPSYRMSVKKITEVRTTDNGWTMVKIQGSKRTFRASTCRDGEIVTLRSNSPTSLHYEIEAILN